MSDQDNLLGKMSDNSSQGEDHILILPVLKFLHISKNVCFMEPNVGEQEMGPVYHSHQLHSVESPGNSGQLVVMGSHQSKHDYVWEGVQGTDYNVNVQDSPDLLCGHCYRPRSVRNCKLGLAGEHML